MLLAITLAVSPVYGHASLISSDPTQGTVLPLPKEITLQFSEEIEQGLSSISLLDSSGKKVEVGRAVLSQRSLSLPVQDLKEGIYTVSWRALSAIDGHITEGSFPIGIGNVSLTLQRQRLKPQAEGFPNIGEVLLRWISFASQTVLFGSIVFMRFIWKASSRRLDSLGNLAEVSFRRTVKLSLIFVMVSTILWWPFQAFTVSSGMSIADAFTQVLATRIGNVWILRMAIVGLALVLRKTKGPWLMVTTGGLLLTTSLNGHNANAGAIAIVSDWVHLIGIGVWVGGLFQMLVTLASIHKDFGEKIPTLLSLLIPRFSMMAILSIVAIGVTGFFSIYLQLKSFGALLSTNYGNSLLMKLLLIVPILLLGVFNQFRIHPLLRKSDHVGRTFLSSVKLEVGLALCVLLLASFLTATSTPLPSTFSENRGLMFTGSSEGVKIGLEVYPGLPGINEFTVKLSDTGGTDVKEVFLQFEAQGAGVGTSSATARPAGNKTYVLVGGYLSLPAKWNLQVQVRRETAYDAIASFEIDLQSRSDLPRSMAEFEIPAWGASPDDIKVDTSGRIWFTAPNAGSIGKFDPKTKTFENYQIPEPRSSPNMLAVTDAIWFTDSQGNRIFRFDPSSKVFRNYRIPTANSVPMGIADGQGAVWFTEFFGNKIGKLNVTTGEITEYPIPTPNAGALAIALDKKGDVWFTESRANRIARLNHTSGKITEYPMGGIILGFPAGIAVAEDGKVWFAEHARDRITRFDPEDLSFKLYPLRPMVGAPYGLVFDRKGDVWFVEHVANAVGQLRVQDGTVVEHKIPTADSNTQWIALDQSGNVWFAEINGRKLGVFGYLSGAVESDPFLANLLGASSVVLVLSGVILLFVARKKLRKVQL